MSSRWHRYTMQIALSQTLSHNWIGMFIQWHINRYPFDWIIGEHEPFASPQTGRRNEKRGNLIPLHDHILHFFFFSRLNKLIINRRSESSALQCQCHKNMKLYRIEITWQWRVSCIIMCDVMGIRRADERTHVIAQWMDSMRVAIEIHSCMAHRPCTVYMNSTLLGT